MTPRFALVVLTLLCAPVVSRAKDPGLAISGIVSEASYHDILATGSMKPTFDERHWILVHGPDIAPWESLQVGDIILFNAKWWNADSYVCHRIVAISSGGSLVVTKGDANDSPDPDYVRKGDYAGLVVGVIRKPQKALDKLGQSK